MTHSHLSCDVFNGLHRYPNSGKYFHTQNTDLIIEKMKEIL